MSRCLMLLLFFKATVFLGQSIPEVLTLPEYLSWVLKEHPEAKNAQLLQESGNAQWLQAKGLLDLSLIHI